MNRPRNSLLIPLALISASCAGESGETNGAAPNEAVAEGEGLLPEEAEALSGAEAEELADEAARDEAADMNLFGGNAAAGETGNDR
jgi:hypothetical protein